MERRISVQQETDDQPIDRINYRGLLRETRSSETCIYCGEQLQDPRALMCRKEECLRLYYRIRARRNRARARERGTSKLPPCPVCGEIKDDLWGHLSRKHAAVASVIESTVCDNRKAVLSLPRTIRNVCVAIAGAGIVKLSKAEGFDKTLLGKIPKKDRIQSQD